MDAPRFADLERTFRELAVAHHGGVGGVLRIDSGRPGPTIGITVCTHGNEPSGLAAVGHALGEGRLGERLARGAVVFVLNNVEAAREFFDDPEFARLREREERGETLDLKPRFLADAFERYRFVDWNMNRLPENVHLRSASDAYEFRRVAELAPIYAAFDAALDIHSATMPIQRVVIPVRGRWEDAGLPIEVVLDGMVDVQIGRPVSWLYGPSDLRGRGPVVGIETGSHASPDSFVSAIECAEAFLRATGALVSDAASAVVPRSYEVDEVAASIRFPDVSYELVREFAQWDAVEVGEILATGAGPPISSPCDGRVLFPPPGRTVEEKELGEEVMFVCRPPRRVRGVAR